MAGIVLMVFLLKSLLAIAMLLAALPARGQAQPSPPGVTLVTLGDSITKGTRPGVKPSQTFAALIHVQLKDKGIDANVVNVGIGGERTDQALKRLQKVMARKPRLVTVMYGTNDSYVDRGKQASRLSLDAYGGNLRNIVAELMRHGIEPILMTEPRWAKDARPNGLGENPNVRLEKYMAACREVARQCQTPLVDHFAHWTKAEKNGQKLRQWTTDGCHPNPRGHQELAKLMLPVLLDALRSDVEAVDLRIKVDTVLKHDDGKFLWFHPRACAIPKGRDAPPTVVMTLQKHLRTSDHYSGLSVMQTTDLGKTFSGPDPRPELDWVREPDGVNIAVADVTPGWHAKTERLIAVGAQVRYSPKGKQLEDKPRAHQTAYAVYDPNAKKWARWRRLEMPPEETFNFARSACAQWLVETDGTVLLPFYIAKSARTPYATTVVRCTFDGKELKYREHGDVLRLNVARGLYEPSLVRFGKRYFLTIRNDRQGYVTLSEDGLHYRPVKPWLFDDGKELGSYNTQQHWLVGGGGLFLVYTRRGANNDHIPRHRAPLFIAQVDPKRLCIIRRTERVLIPERGATLGNFGAAAVTEQESWVTVAEGVWNEEARRRGAEGALFVARVVWSQ